jgi:hypothetical protein
MPSGPADAVGIAYSVMAPSVPWRSAACDDRDGSAEAADAQMSASAAEQTGKASEADEHFTGDTSDR